MSEEYDDVFEQPVRRPKDKCLSCKRGLTWMEKKTQFMRMLRRDVPLEVAKKESKRCQKCMTVYLKQIGAASESKATGKILREYLESRETANERRRTQPVDRQ